MTQLFVSYFWNNADGNGHGFRVFDRRAPRTADEVTELCNVIDAQYDDKTMSIPINWIEMEGPNPAQYYDLPDD